MYKRKADPDQNWNLVWLTLRKHVKRQASNSVCKGWPRTSVSFTFTDELTTLRSAEQTIEYLESKAS